MDSPSSIESSAVNSISLEGGTSWVTPPPPPTPPPHNSSMQRLWLAYCYVGLVYAATTIINSYGLSSCFAAAIHLAERYEHLWLRANLYSTDLHNFTLLFLAVN